jgi:UDP-N-acetylglucosamine 2-epimerase (non-hydrolysing)
MNIQKKNILCVVGTRPEAIKMAPIVLKLQEQQWADVSVLATGQHKELLSSVLDCFGIVPKHNMGVMTENQSLSGLTSKILSQANDFFERYGRPDVVLVQGDTTTVFAICLAAFYLNIPIAHVEAGLRTFDIRNPFPEEMNLIFASKLSQWHFAHTEIAANNLRSEGVSDNNILVTGNTVIDALFLVKRVPLSCEEKIGTNKLILVTTHRRENFGKPLLNIFSALNRLASEYPDISILIPLHPNPNLKQAAMEARS